MESNGKLPEENEKKPDVPVPRTSSPLHKHNNNAKATEILEACKWRDIETLRALATSEGGLLSDDLRRQACSFDQTPRDLPEPKLTFNGRVLTSRVFQSRQ